ncbi:hypothetical protein [Paenibacillus rhizoplanae]
MALNHLTGTYNARIRLLKKNEDAEEMERKLGVTALKWQREYTMHALKQHEVNPYTAYRYLNRLNRQLFIYTRDPQYKNDLIPFKSWEEITGVIQQVRLNAQERREESNRLQSGIFAYVLEQLRELQNTGEMEPEVISSLILRYERGRLRLTRQESISATKREFEESLHELSRAGIQLERDNIQLMFEAGRISRASMKEMKRDILFMEHDLREEMG